MTTDPIADLLTRIRNANLSLLEKVDIPASRIKVEIARILKAEGFIRNFRVLESKPHAWLRVYLRYEGETGRVLQGIERASKPGRRIYVNVGSLPLIRNGLGVAILSTPRGILTDREARDRRVGGELLCTVW